MNLQSTRSYILLRKPNLQHCTDNAQITANAFALFAVGVTSESGANATLSVKKSD